jgi:hypothetical protein
MVDGHVVGEQFELFGIIGEFVYLAEKELWNSKRGTQVYRIIERWEKTNLLQIYKPCCQWADHFGQRWGAVQYHVLEQARILEKRKDRQRRIHSGQDRGLEARRIERIDRLAEAKGTDDVDRHAAESIVHIGALRRFHAALECRAELLRFLYT